MADEEAVVEREDPVARHERQAQEKRDYIEARRVRLGGEEKPKPKSRAKAKNSEEESE